MHHDDLSNLPFGRVGTHSGNGQLMGLQVQLTRYPDETICLCRYENDRNGICYYHEDCIYSAVTIGTYVSSIVTPDCSESNRQNMHALCCPSADFLPA
jgi:hypothetical protein